MVENLGNINIKNLEYLTNNIIEIFKYLDTKETLDLTGDLELRKELNKKYDKFFLEYSVIERLIFTCEDLTYLFKVLKLLNKVKKGEEGKETIVTEFNRILQEAIKNGKKVKN